MNSHNKTLNVLSFDVEDWYQGFVYRNIGGWEKFESREAQNIDRILGILEGTGTTATFFVLGQFAEAHPEVVRRIAAQGHEIASHGYAHKPIPELGSVAFREDTRRSVDGLEAIVGAKIRGYRAPSWSMTKDCIWALEILVEEGFQYDSSVFPTRMHKFGYPGAPLHPYRIDLTHGRFIYEFPAQVLSLAGLRFPAAGGFYLRALPLFASRWALKQSERKNRTGMVYLHPFDLDSQAPVLKTGLMFHIIRYYNLHRTESYLKELIKEFNFCSIREILASQQIAANIQSVDDLK